jgi:hypothetical protein
MRSDHPHGREHHVQMLNAPARESLDNRDIEQDRTELANYIQG